MEYKKIEDVEYITLSKEDLRELLSTFDEKTDVHRFFPVKENTKIWIGVVHKHKDIE